MPAEMGRLQSARLNNALFQEWGVSVSGPCLWSFYSWHDIRNRFTNYSHTHV